MSSFSRNGAKHTGTRARCQTRGQARMFPAREKFVGKPLKGSGQRPRYKPPRPDGTVVLVETLAVAGGRRPLALI